MVTVPSPRWVWVERKNQFTALISSCPTRKRQQVLAAGSDSHSSMDFVLKWMALPWNLCLITGFSFTLNGTKTNQTMMEKKKKKKSEAKVRCPFPRVSASYAWKSKSCRSSRSLWQSAFAIVSDTRTWLSICLANTGVLNAARCWGQETHLRLCSSPRRNRET